MTARRLAAAVVLFGAATLRAQEFDIFEANDFVDPRERGAVFSAEQRFGVTDPGQPFTVMRVFTGRIVNDYQWRNVPTGAESNFVHLATTFYRGDKQFTAKLTSFYGDDDAQLPSYRGTLQFGQYFVTAAVKTREEEPQPDVIDAEAEDDSSEDDVRAAGRYLLTAGLEHNPFDDGPLVLYEYGIESTGYVRKGNTAVSGSLVWTHRIVSEEKSIDRVSYYYRFGDRTYLNGRFRGSASAGIGGERNDGWHWGAMRVVLTGSVEIPLLRTGLNVAYAPTFVPGRATRNTYHEVAVFLDTTALRRLGRLID